MMAKVLLIFAVSFVAADADYGEADPTRTPVCSDVEEIRYPLGATSCSDAGVVCFDGHFRDFTMDGESQYWNPDFQHDLDDFCTGVVANLVTDNLGEDGMPVFSSSMGANRGNCDEDTPVITSADTFSQWFASECDANSKYYAFHGELALTVEDDGSTYSYHEDNFHPMDLMAAGSWPGFGHEGLTACDSTNRHNFGFTSHLSATFRMPVVTFGEETNFFEITADDDVWVFINGQLAIDLGGVHSAQTRQVSFDNCELETVGDMDQAYFCGSNAISTLDGNAIGPLYAGQSYQIDIFQADRQHCDSTFGIRTTLPMNTASPPPSSPPPSPPPTSPPPPRPTQIDAECTLYPFNADDSTTSCSFDSDCTDGVTNWNAKCTKVECPSERRRNRKLMFGSPFCGKCTCSTFTYAEAIAAGRVAA